MIIDCQAVQVMGGIVTSPDWVHGTFPKGAVEIVETQYVAGQSQETTINIQTTVDDNG